MILDYKGSKIFYSDEGQGETIVLLHGFLENSSMWETIKAHLSDSYRVVTIDLLGHGQTGCIGYIHTMEMMADAVKAVIDKLKIESIILIGHSMGGYVALAFSEQYPGLINGLCLMNSTAVEDNIERKINRDRAIEAVKNNYRTFIGISIVNLFAPHNRVRFKKQIELVKREALNTPLQGVVAALEGMKLRPNREHILHNKSFRKLMIIGRNDPVLEYDTLIEQLRSSTIEIVEFPDGHMSHIENMNELTYKISRFIEK